MNKENSVLIRINDLADVKKFANEVTSFESDVNIYYNENKFYDAKSILAIIALDISQKRYVEIISNDSDEIKRFKECMKEFECNED